MSEKEPCQFNFTDRNQYVIACRVHGERETLKPATREATLSELAQAGKWAGPPRSLPVPSSSPQSTELPAVPTTSSYDVVEYCAPDGQAVSLSLSLFRTVFCSEANDTQARYMLGWCQHNRIDPFSNEAYFSVMSGKPVIQVSKDAWFRRMERHPQFSHFDSGIIVELSLNELKAAVLGGMGDQYLVAQAVKDRLLQNALEGKSLDPKGFPSRFIVRKRGQYVAAAETLEGGWAVIHRKDRPHPIEFHINLEGWQGRKQNGDENIFWIQKAPFMIWKTALKNCTRLAFPELSGLIAQPEADFDPAALADAEYTAPSSLAQKRKLFAVGRDVPSPLGPLAYPQLHAVARALYDGKGISELTMMEMAALIDRIERATGGDPHTLDELQTLLHEQDTAEQHAARAEA